MKELAVFIQDINNDEYQINLHIERKGVVPNHFVSKIETLRKIS